MSFRHTLTIVTTLSLPLVVGACSLFTKQNAKTVLNVVEMACVIADEFSKTPREIANACHIADDLIPEVDKLLEARKAAAKKASASTSTIASVCPSAAPVVSASALPKPPTSASASTTPPKPATSTSTAKK